MHLYGGSYRSTGEANIYLRYIRRFSPNAGGCLEEIRKYGEEAVEVAALIAIAYKQDMTLRGFTPDSEDYLENFDHESEMRPLLEYMLSAMATDWEIGNTRQ